MPFLKSRGEISLLVCPEARARARVPLVMAWPYIISLSSRGKARRVPRP